MQLVSRIAIAGFAACFVGCASLVQYAPQPARISDPGKELDKILRGTAERNFPYCVTKIEVVENVVNVNYACARSAQTGQRSARLDRIRAIVWEGGAKGHYRVTVHHRSDQPDFVWYIDDREDAEHLIDSMTALSQSKP